MRRQVEVGPVGDALELGEVLAAEAEPVLDVDRALRVVGELLLGVLEEAQVVGRQAEVEVPVPALLEPVLVPLLVGARLDEELHLHLLELAGPEDEVARRDLVAERLAGLGDAERRLLARRGHDVLEVDEDALRGLRSQVVQALLALHRAEVGLEQAAELARLGEGALGAAVRAVDLGQAARARRPLRRSKSSSRWSTRNRLWQFWHSVSGSVKVSTWPEATQTSRGRMTAESRPTTSSRRWTIARHHCRRMFSFSSTPSGP